MDTGRSLDGHHVLDLTPRRLDLDGQLEFDLLWDRPALLLRLGLDLCLDLSGHMWGQGREELYRLLESRDGDELVSYGGLNLDLPRDSGLGLGLELYLEFSLHWRGLRGLGLGLDLMLLLLWLLKVDLD